MEGPDEYDLVAKEVAEEQLTLERSKQTIIKGWKRPQKKSGEAK